MYCVHVCYCSLYGIHVLIVQQERKKLVILVYDSPCIKQRKLRQRLRLPSIPKKKNTKIQNVDILPVYPRLQRRRHRRPRTTWCSTAARAACATSSVQLLLTLRPHHQPSTLKSSNPQSIRSSARSSSRPIEVRFVLRTAAGEVWREASVRWSRPARCAAEFRALG